MGPDEDEPLTSLRMVVRSDGDGVRIEKIVRLGMIAPAGEQTLLDDHSGAWVELRDAEGRVLYQRVIRLPREPLVEAPDEPGTRRMAWRERPRTGGALDVVVPDLARAATVQVVASSRDRRVTATTILADVPGLGR